jgi:hypothetical protein
MERTKVIPRSFSATGELVYHDMRPKKRGNILGTATCIYFSTLLYNDDWNLLLLIFSFFPVCGASPGRRDAQFGNRCLVIYSVEW